MRVTCDSDVLSNFGRGRGRGAREVRDAIANGSLWLNVIALFETRGGMQRHEHVVDFDRRLGHLPVLELTHEAALRAGDLWRELRGRKLSMHIRDLLMAAVADVGQARLLTADADFKPLLEIGLNIDILTEESQI